VLRKYGVSFVYVGAMERQAYGPGTLGRLAGLEGTLVPVFANPGVTLFAVKRGDVESRPVPIPTPPPASGPPPGSFRQPRGVAVDEAGNVYVADFNNHRIQKLGPGLEPIAAWGSEGSSPGLFRQPCQVAVRGDEVLVADTWNGRIQVLGRDGAYLRDLATGLYGPRGIAVAPDGAVYVADTGNHRVRRFGAEGREEGGFGARGSGPGQFLEPVGIAVGADGRVYVCDNGNARLQVFDAKGGFLKAIPVPGWRLATYSEPKVTLAQDLIWVTVPLADQVRAYSHEGALVRTLDGGDAPGAPFGKPFGIAYNPVTRELVVTELQDRVSRIALPQQAGKR
jgi:DNA-binding beta-propeller fold protein YncE